MTRRAWVIARGEFVLLARSRVAWLGVATLLALSATATLTSWAHVAAERAERAGHQHATDELFAAQPDRHPHRMVHYGTYVFRPPGALAAFDPGVDAFTGTTLYLEGHRQNSATFGAVRESSSLIRFGQLTPAFVLQTLAPLLLVFLGFHMVAREREQGTLAQLLAHGATSVDILLGKGLALGGVATLAVSPALFALATVPAAEAPAALAIAAACVLYLLLWVALVVALSALSATARTSLVALVAAWVFATVLVPRLAADHASRAVALQSSAEASLALQAELRRVGDSHDANDPFFTAFRERVLRQYGVSRIEDLPVNFRGLVSEEGEALTSRLFAEYAARAAATLRAQVARLDRAQLASPALALRRVSLAAAGTDLENHLAFLEQAEAHRYDMVQRLNRSHAQRVSLADDVARNVDPASERRSRVSQRTWAEIPEFRFASAPAPQRAARAGQALAVLAAWLACAAALLVLASRRLATASR